MILCKKTLPALDIDYGIYRPFIKNEWFRKHYMWFAYGLMAVLFVAAFLTGGFRAGNIFIRTGIATVFISGALSEYLRYIAWINAIIAGSDIINSFLILIKPARSSFIRGFYRTR